MLDRNALLVGAAEAALSAVFKELERKQQELDTLYLENEQLREQVHELRKLKAR